MFIVFISSAGNGSMIAIIDYGAGNLTSVRLALDTIAVEATITSDPAVIMKAERIIFPGVGAAGAAMQSLRRLGLEQPLQQVTASGTPFLGICLGTQIIFEHSAEDGGVDCLGLLKGRVVRFQPQNHWDKVPQMGWNAVKFTRPHPLTAGIEDNTEFYFVHSYYPQPADINQIIGQTTYAGNAIAAVSGNANIVATQFHPEKSGRAGLQMLHNFINWNP
jgi:imidazole glycerol-phosphate synthase subunit HisH